MKFVCFTMCVLLTSYTIAHTLNEVHAELTQILEYADSNFFKLKVIVNRNGSTDSHVLGQTEAMKERIFARIEKLQRDTVSQLRAIEHSMGIIKLMLTRGVEGIPFICTDLQRRGIYTSGVYNMFLNTEEIQVYCDMDTDGGGWLVFQRRTNDVVDFDRKWRSYKKGFGNVKRDFWLGNENLYQIIRNSGSEFEIRFELENFDNEKRYAKYSTFDINDEADNYRLTVSNYTGNAGDSFSSHNGQQFTTKDRDNDEYPENCAASYTGGWWFKSCHDSNLNGVYPKSRFEESFTGIVWRSWVYFPYSLKMTEMKIRPKQ